MLLQHWPLELSASFQRYSYTSSLIYDGVNFNLNQPFLVDERLDLHDRVDGPDVFEIFPTYFSNFLPILNSSKQHARSNNVAQRGPSLFKRGLDRFQALAGLRPGIANSYGPAVRVYRGSAAN